jgi:hypothetical protein
MKEKENTRIESYIFGTLAELTTNIFETDKGPFEGYRDGLNQGRYYMESFNLPISPGRETALRGLVSIIKTEKGIYRGHLEVEGSLDVLPENIPQEKRKYIHAFTHGLGDSLEILTDYTSTEQTIFRALNTLEFK